MQFTALHGDHGRNLCHGFGVESTYIDTTDLEQVKNAIRPNTSLIYLESPANPTIGISDIPAICEIAHQHNIPVCVDNTFCSPYLQNPLDMGADVVLHSLTKFLNGHADIIGGMIVSKTEEHYKKLRTMMVNLGCNMDPHQAFLTRRGLKTLALRIDRAQESALKIAKFSRISSESGMGHVSRVALLTLIMILEKTDAGLRCHDQLWPERRIGYRKEAHECC